MRFQLLLQNRFGCSTNLLVHHFAILYKKYGWDVHDPVLLGDLGVVIHVDFANVGLSAVFFG